MSIGLAMNLGSVALPATAPTQAQLNSHIAMTASANVQAQDKLVRDRRRSEAMRLVGNRVAQKRVLDAAGVTKPSAAKRA